MNSIFFTIVFYHSFCEIENNPTMKCVFFVLYGVCYAIASYQQYKIKRRIEALEDEAENNAE